uniref:Aldehyde dehydrogenase domain-containing protein n=1 Tax=Acyrthosiphon pisum TaxID=7029 RepID=A0A8R2D8A0_ACYPI
MTLTGELFIATQRQRGAAQAFQAIDPQRDCALEPNFFEADASQIDAACQSAAEALIAYGQAGLDVRARFLRQIGENILALGDELIERAMQETALPRARIEGERGRTIGQLNLFADVVDQGAFQGALIEPALPDRQPLPRPDLRQRLVPLGPVAIFGASNFPLAFSVAGGDTASALAAGCPVVVKAHPAHPGTSELVARAITQAVIQCELPVG